MKPTIIILGALMLIGSPVTAHDFWANGQPIPKWVKSAGCGVNDVHFESRLVKTDKGYLVDDLPSQDCLFIPFNS